MEDKKCLQTLCALRRGVLGVGRKVLGYGRRGALGRKVVGYGRLGAALIIAIATLAWASGAAASTCKAIHVFTGTGGAQPMGNLTQDAAGNLYGTTGYGGGSGCTGGCGVVWKLAPNPNGTWTYSILHAFTGTDGGNPQAGLIFDPAGNFYGTTFYGGGSGCFHSGCGVVYKLAPNPNGTWTYSTLHSFTGADGINPSAGLVFDAAGNLYGTTYAGGASGAGSVFKLAPNPDGTWTESVLYSFKDGADGGFPVAELIFDSSVNLYGTTTSGGTFSAGACPGGCGVAFRLAPNPKETWTESVLYGFTGTPNGADPDAGLILDTAGNLYGTTNFGGGDDQGVVFKLAPNPKGTWTESVLYSFTGGADGGFPDEAGVIFDAAGDLYGTTYEGGAAGRGVVFKLAPTSSGWNETVLHTFLGFGSNPLAPVIFDAAGNLYGTTRSGTKNSGLVFEITGVSK